MAVVKKVTCDRCRVDVEIGRTFDFPPEWIQTFVAFDRQGDIQKKFYKDLCGKCEDAYTRMLNTFFGYKNPVLE